MLVTREDLLNLSSYEIEQLLSILDEETTDKVIMLMANLSTEDSIEIPDGYI